MYIFMVNRTNLKQLDSLGPRKSENIDIFPVKTEVYYDKISTFIVMHITYL